MALAIGKGQYPAWDTIITEAEAEALKEEQLADLSPDGAQDPQVAIDCDSAAWLEGEMGGLSSGEGESAASWDIDAF